MLCERVEQLEKYMEEVGVEIMELGNMSKDKIKLKPEGAWNDGMEVETGE